MTANSPHAIFNCAVGANQTGPAVATGDSVLYLLGGNLSPAAAAAALTVGYPSNLSTVLLTLAAPASGGTAGGVFPSVCAIQGGALFYTLSGAGATAQLYWQTG